jgi:mono/diheme cytochrome c family protein
MKIITAKSTFAKLIVTFFVLVCFSSAVVAQHKAPWNAPESLKDKKNPFATDESSLARGKKSYISECARCHGKKGEGDGSSASRIDQTVADLSSAKVQSQSDGELFWKISEGRKPMPINKNTLTDDQRWDIINYIRTFKKK